MRAELDIAGRRGPSDGGAPAPDPAEADPLRRDWRGRLADASLSALLVLQGLTLFVAVPLGGSDAGRVVLDACHLLYAGICVVVLARHAAVRLGLLAGLALLVLGPAAGRALGGTSLYLTSPVRHEVIALAAFGFNAGVTGVVMRRVFAPGRVTVHRVRGAVLLYLNVAALFAIAYGVLAMHAPDAFVAAHGALPLARTEAGTAEFSYFSLTTITTTGYGDLLPMHPLARSLANLEAVFGQLFPATLLTRLVSLHLRHEAAGEAQRAERTESARKPS